MTLYQQKQDFLTEIMAAKDIDVKLFRRLIKRHRTLPNTATQVLVYDGETLCGSSNIAAGFVSHFQPLATPSTNDDSSCYLLAWRSCLAPCLMHSFLRGCSVIC